MDAQNAFPKTAEGAPDFVGHRVYHDSRIRAAQAEERFWTELKLEVAKKGTIGILTIIVGLVLAGLSVKLFGGIPNVKP